MDVKLLVCCIVLKTVHGFYLPGVAPHNYKQGEMVKIKVNKIDSVHTQLPYAFYDLPFCRPTKIAEDLENLGEVLRGDVIENAPYKVYNQKTENCKVLCRKLYSKKQIKAFRAKIRDEYRVNMICDNLPAVKQWQYKNPENGKTEYVYEEGYPIGYTDIISNHGPGSEEARYDKNTNIYLNNDLKIMLHYHTDPSTYVGYRMVGFDIQEQSIQHEYDGSWKPGKKLNTCHQHRRRMVIGGKRYKPGRDGKTEVIWTYSVHWKKSNIKWASRWDAYLKMTQPKIHWFSILNSFMIVLFLTGMVALILMRALHKDIRTYNADDEEAIEEAREERGWKLVHGEVFRPPACPGFFAVLVGSGVQVFCMAILTLFFAALGLLSPANRGALMTALVILYTFMGILAGYTSATVYKLLMQTEWKRNTIWTALFFPGVNFFVFFILNLLVWSKGSSGAVPFGTMFALLGLWFGISVPLVYLGAYFGYKRERDEMPCRVNALERLIPPQEWYMSPWVMMIIGGILPFGACFIEVFFIFSSVWLHRFYYMFGFLFAVFLLLIIMSAEITIVMTYFQLCSEDYHWWWRSFITAGASAVYLFFYSILYFFRNLDIKSGVSGWLYFGYMFLASFAFFILNGTVGYFSCLTFIRVIYGAIKVD